MTTDELREDLVLGETLAVGRTGMKIHAQNIDENTRMERSSPCFNQGRYIKIFDTSDGPGIV